MHAFLRSGLRRMTGAGLRGVPALLLLGAAAGASALCLSDADCADGNPCTPDTCVLGVCFVDIPAPIGPSSCNGDENCPTGSVCVRHFCVCEDGDPCTIGSCTSTGCVQTPKNCNDHNQCTDDFCDLFGNCQHVALTRFGQPCDDGNACTRGETCTLDGKCVAPPRSRVSQKTIALLQ